MKTSLVITGLLLLAVVAWHSAHPVSAAGSTLASFDGVKAITLVFGSKDAEPNIWDGSVSMANS
jgi:hypothetical protein